MVHRRQFRKFHPKHTYRPPQNYLLDKFFIKDIRKWRMIKDNVLKYHWDYYSDLAYQRSKIIEQIKNSLLEAAIRNFQFEHWQRAVKYKYAIDPLSTSGSLIDPGGRFNIGDINVFKENLARQNGREKWCSKNSYTGKEIPMF